MGGTSHTKEYEYRIYTLDIMAEPDAPVEIVYTFDGFQKFWQATDLNAVMVVKNAIVHEVKTSRDGKEMPGLVIPKKTKKISIRTPQGAANPRSCSTVVDKNLQNANGVIPLNIQAFFGKTNQR